MNRYFTSVLQATNDLETRYRYWCTLHSLDIMSIIILPWLKLQLSWAMSSCDLPCLCTMHSTMLTFHVSTWGSRRYRYRPHMLSMALMSAHVIGIVDGSFSIRQMSFRFSIQMSVRRCTQMNKAYYHLLLTQLFSFVFRSQPREPCWVAAKWRASFVSVSRRLLCHPLEHSKRNQGSAAESGNLGRWVVIGSYWVGGKVMSASSCLRSMSKTMFKC